MHMYKVLRGGTLTIAALILIVAPALSADESDIAGRAAAWQEAYNAGNLEAVAALYTEDSCRMPPNLETVEGQEAIVGNLQAFKDMGGAQVNLAVTEAESVGDMAYGAGTYEITGADGSHVDHGKWLNVSKRVNGEWKIYCDIWNTNMPLPTP